MKKKLKKLAVVAGILALGAITVYVLWASWENWTGARAWKEVRTTLEKNDVKLELVNMLPEPISAADNFCSTPLIASLLEYEWTGPSSLSDPTNPSEGIVYSNPELRDRVLKLKLPTPRGGVLKSPALPKWESATRADLKGFLQLLQSADASTASILDWMAQFDSELAEIDSAARRPDAQVGIQFSENFIENVSMPTPRYSEFQDLGKFEAIRACAALDAGDTKQARAALLTIMQLSRAAASHQTLIGFLVGQSQMDIFLSVVWHGIAANLWSADDLKWIGDLLSSENFLGQLERALNVEMVMLQIGAPEFLKNISASDSMKLGFLGLETKGSPAGLTALLVPDGIWDHNKAFGCRLAFEQGILPVRERRIPDEAELMEELKRRSPRTFLASISLPAVSQVIKKGFFTSVAIDLARVACAVECFKLENGDFPDTLDQLVPAFIDAIPTDLMAPGQLLKYGKNLHGERYRIYSIGKNGTDDGGEAAFRDNSKEPPRRDLDLGDWAWGYQLQAPAADR